MDASASYRFAAPTIVGGAVLLHSFVVHETKPAGGVFPGAAGNAANLHAANDNASPLACPYKALGNSMAVPVMHWIGERIAKVEALTDSLEQAA
jgi:site-specific DNA-cytosine methylase